MEKAAKFEKVSYPQFSAAWRKYRPDAAEEEVRTVYDGIVLPKRATKGSAGYDFFAPAETVLGPGEEITIPTGIRVKIKPGYVLILFPRSSLGFRYRLQLNNTAGIIDSDYYHAENEGHIFVRMINDSRQGQTVRIEPGQGMVQGILLPFGIAEDDEAMAERTGGFGSTDSRKQV